MHVTSDVGAYGVIPLWLIERHPSSKALHLYAVLITKYADKEGQSFPSRKTLARDLGHDRMVSEITVDRASKELVELGALQVTHRDIEGVPTSNHYQVKLLPPGNTDVTNPGNTNVTKDGNTNVALTNTGVLNQYEGSEPSTKKVTKELAEAHPLVTKEKSKWYSILSRDKRWPEKNAIWLEDFESSFCRMQGVDLDSARAALEFEALRCVGWLESPKGQGKKLIDRVWENWISKVIKDSKKGTITPYSAPAALRISKETPTLLQFKAEEHAFKVLKFHPVTHREQFLAATQEYMEAHAGE